MEKPTSRLLEKIASIFESEVFNFLLLVLFLIFFCWPYVSPAGTQSLEAPFYLEFKWWAVLIALLAIGNIAMNVRDNNLHD